VALGLLGAKPKVAKNQQVSLLEIRRAVLRCGVRRSRQHDDEVYPHRDEHAEGKAYVVNKVVNMTRDVRDPKPGEEIFGRTLTYKPLTRNSIAEMVKGTLIKSVRNANLELADDLHFVVRSTALSLVLTSPRILVSL